MTGIFFCSYRKGVAGVFLWRMLLLLYICRNTRLFPPISPSQFSTISLYLISICKDIYGMIVELRNGAELLGKSSKVLQNSWRNTKLLTSGTKVPVV